MDFSASDSDAFSVAVRSLAAFEPKPLTQNFAVAVAVLMHRVTAGGGRSASCPTSAWRCRHAAKHARIAASGLRSDVVQSGRIWWCESPRKYFQAIRC